MRIKFVIKKSNEYYVAYIPSIPACISYGKTKEEAIKNVKEALRLHLLITQGES